MTVRYSALALCRATFEAGDGGPARAIELDMLAVSLDVTRQRADVLAAFAERKGWLKRDGACVLLLEEGQRQVQAPVKLGFHHAAARKAAGAKSPASVAADDGGHKSAATNPVRSYQVVAGSR